MTKEEKIFEIAKAIAPIFAKEGIQLQQSIIRNGGNPQGCKIGDKDILHSYGENLQLWATAFVEELENSDKSVLVNVENWNDGDYAPIRSKSGKLYQFYEKVNPETGEKAYQIAEYLYDDNYVSEECFKELLNA